MLRSGVNIVWNSMRFSPVIHKLVLGRSSPSYRIRYSKKCLAWIFSIYSGDAFKHKRVVWMKPNPIIQLVFFFQITGYEFIIARSSPASSCWRKCPGWLLFQRPQLTWRQCSPGRRGRVHPAAYYRCRSPRCGTP